MTSRSPRWFSMSRLARPVRRDDEGFGLIELIMSLSVFAVLIGGLIVTMTAGLALARSNRERSVAANLAAKEIDSIRQAVFSSLTIGFSTSTVAVDGVNFTVDRNLEWVNNAATAGECDSTTTTPQVVRVTIEVTWSVMKAVQPVRTSTVLSPPVGSYDPNSGHVAVRVRDAGAVPLGGVPVRVVGTGIDRTLSTTDASAASPGCAFFGFLPAQSYTVSLGSAGWVDRQGAASPSQTVGVNVGQVASVAFDYDRAATLDVTIAGANGGTPADAMPVTLGNTGYLPSGTKTFAGTGPTRSLTDLFPFNDGYEGWAGSCADADPEGKDNVGDPYWPDATRANTLEVEPALTTSGTVVAATVRITYSEGGAPDGSDTVIATHGADTGCSSGETFSVATISASSDVVFVALPYGTWTLTVPGHSPVGSWPVITLDPRSSATVDATVSI